MIQIVPAIMPRSFKDLEHSLSAVSGVAPLVQVDIMDGIYTESSTWPYATGDSIADFVSGE